MFQARRKAVALAATGAVAALVVAGLPASAGGRDLSDRLEAADLAKFTPPSMNLDAKGAYIVRLKAAPVVTQGAVDKVAAREAVLRGQTPVIDAASKLGAVVGRRYADAINGFAFTGTGRAAQALAKNPAVEGISPVQTYSLDNAVSNAMTGSSATWDETGFTGKGVKIAIIDSGVDYYHKMFGGSGLDAYNADDSTVIEPGTFPTTKVIGGYDFVGDAYDARYSDAAHAPVPDADPRDCSVFGGAAASAGGHGSHVAGTAAGFGVNTDGTTFAGPFTAASQAGLAIGSGSAPEASLLAYRVFGCNGSTNSDVVVAAINAAVAAGAGVINMSLGSSFGRADGAYAAAITNAVKAGTVVVCSAGNSGPEPYITGSPGSTPAALSVAALNKNNIPASLNAVSSNGKRVDGLGLAGSLVPADGLTVYSAVLANATKRLACNNSDLQDANGNSLVTGKLVVIQRGTCTFVVKEAVAVANGAAAVIMLNSSAGGDALVSPALNGLVPFVVSGYTSTKINTFYAMNDATVNFEKFYGSAASFTSGGPRYGDAGFKPDIAAPGVNIRSTAVGTGTGYADFSGTSMASPHTAGTVALVRQAHPTWNAFQVKAAMVNAASRDAALLQQNTRITGNGITQPKAAIANGVLVYPSSITKDGDTSLSFGVREEASATSARQITVANLSNASQTVTLSASFEGSPAGASMSFSRNNITLGAGKSATLTATLSLNSTYMSGRGGASSTIKTLYGQVIATRGDSKASTMPFSAVPASRSAVNAKVAGSTLSLKNSGGSYGSADLWELLVTDKKDTAAGVDIRSLGAQYYTEADLGLSASSNKFVLFNISTYNMIYNPADTQWWIDIDTTGDGNADFELFMFDSGYMGTGSFNGKVGAYLYYLDAASGTWKSKTGAYTIFRPLNSSIFQVGFQTSALCDGGGTGDTACAAAPSQNLKWNVVSVGATNWDDVTDSADTASGTVAPSNPVRSWGDWADLDPAGESSFTLSTRALTSGEKKTAGWQVVFAENRAGQQTSEIFGF